MGRLVYVREVSDYCPPLYRAQPSHHADNPRFAQDREAEPRFSSGPSGVGRGGFEGGPRGGFAGGYGGHMGGGMGGGMGGMAPGGSRQIYVSNVCPLQCFRCKGLADVLLASLHRRLARSQGPVSPGR